MKKGDHGTGKFRDHHGDKEPGPEFLERREQLNTLASLPQEEVEAALEKWPPYAKMSLGQRGQLLQRIQKMRDRRREEAQRKARELNLNIPADQMDTFIRAFWDEKLELDKQFWEEIKPLRQKYNNELNEALLKSYQKYQTKDAKKD